MQLPLAAICGGRSFTIQDRTTFVWKYIRQKGCLWKTASASAEMTLKCCSRVDYTCAIADGESLVAMMTSGQRRLESATCIAEYSWRPRHQATQTSENDKTFLAFLQFERFLPVSWLTVVAIKLKQVAKLPFLQHLELHWHNITCSL